MPPRITACPPEQTFCHRGKGLCTESNSRNSILPAIDARPGKVPVLLAVSRGASFPMRWRMDVGCCRFTLTGGSAIEYRRPWAGRGLPIRISSLGVSQVSSAKPSINP